MKDQKPVYQVAIVDDHILFAEGFQTLLKKFDNLNVAGVYSDGSQLENDPILPKLDVIFMDLMMKKRNGFESTETILKKEPHIKIVAVSSCDDVATIHKIFQKGAVGYITKGSSIKNISDVIEIIANGKKYIQPEVAERYKNYVSSLFSSKNTTPEMDKWGLTARDMEIITLLSLGKKAREIAEILKLRRKTIEAEKKKIADKLGLKRTSEIVPTAFKLKLLS